MALEAIHTRGGKHDVAQPVQIQISGVPQSLADSINVVGAVSSYDTPSRTLTLTLSGVKRPTTILSVSDLMMAESAILTNTPASAAWFAANQGIYVPFVLHEPATAVRMFTVNGGTAAGNTDVGIYNESLTRLVSIGPTAQAGINTTQFFDIADTPLAAGAYYMALSNSLATSTFLMCRSLIANGLRAQGLWEQAAVGTLPNPAVPVAFTRTSVPYFGIEFVSGRII